MALASEGSLMFPLVVHQPASPSIWPAVQSLRRGLSTNPGATMWCVCGVDGVNEEMEISGAGGNNGGEAGAEGVRGVVGFIGDEDWLSRLIIILSMSS